MNGISVFFRKQAIRLLISLLLLSVSTSWLQAQDEEESPPPFLVITELRSMGAQMSVAETRAFSEFIRRTVERSGRYIVLSSSSVQAILAAKSFDRTCYELPCFVEMGNLLGAEFVLAGQLHRRDNGELEVTLRVVNVEEESIENTVYRKTTLYSVEDLLADWGLTLISQLLDIPAEQLQASQGAIEANQTNAIPDAIRFRYPGMIYIPEGIALVGANQGEPLEQPQHEVEVDAFYISQHEITNQEYKAFVDDTGHPVPRHWVQGQIPVGKERHPVTWLSFEDAEAYCEWKGGRLPTEIEWVRAARGNNERLYPWGGSFDPDRANTWESGIQDTVPVGQHRSGASPFGVHDMAGNAFEWTSSFLRPYPGANIELEPQQTIQRVLRGGSWNFDSYYARIPHRMARPGGESSRTFGFRLVRDATGSAPPVN